MKKVFFLFLACSSLFGYLPFTLDNLQNLRVLFVNKAEFVTQAHEAQMKENIINKLSAHGIKFNQPDASTLMIKIETFKIDKTFIVHTQFIIAEEVQTKRLDHPESLAFTYYSSDLIDTQDPYTDTVESVEFLVNEFLELYDEDNTQ